MTRIYKISLIFILLIALVCPTHSSAKLFSKKNKQEEVDIHGLSIEENIATPELGKQANTIVKFQDVQAKAIEKLVGKDTPYIVQKIRNGEVLMITIPAHSLFSSNDTVLTEKGKNTLVPLCKYLNTPGLYKMVLVMHSDNTGNEIYTQKLTEGRVNSVYEWIIETDNSKSDVVVPYALGSDDPIVDNNSITNRAKNRRLVIYLIPDKAMINQAKRGKITL